MASATVPLYQSEITSAHIRGRMISYVYSQHYSYILLIVVTASSSGALLGVSFFSTLFNSAALTSQERPHSAFPGVYK